MTNKTYSRYIKLTNTKRTTQYVSYVRRNTWTNLQCSYDSHNSA